MVKLIITLTEDCESEAEAFERGHEIADRLEGMTNLNIHAQTASTFNPMEIPDDPD